MARLHGKIVLSPAAVKRPAVPPWPRARPPEADMSTADAATPEHKPNWLKQYFLDFKVLGDNPFAFWVVQFINLLDSLG